MSALNKPENAGRFWISPGARLGLAVALMLITLLITFVAVPFYADQAQQRQDRQDAAAAQVVRQQQTQQFLHKFDCTYGVSLKAVLTQLGNDEERAASRALAGIQAARAVHDTRREAVSRKAREDALRASGTYRALKASIPTLDGAGPCYP
jgi:cbb3-type cytochrome oxidase subunit 3